MHSVKQAFGGQGQDVPFEQAFSDVAHTILRDRAPQLFDHEIGFQLVDRDDDGSKAFGVMGFKIGPMLLYAPLFFLNGATKGHELLIVVDNNMFVPLKENWINELTARQPVSIGTAINRRETRESVRKPSLLNLKESPTLKYANSEAAVLSKYAAWSRDGVVACVKASQEKPETDIRPFLKKGGLPLISQLLKVAEKYPVVEKALFQFYSPQDFSELVESAVKQAAVSSSILDAKPVRANTKTAGSVLVYRYDLEINSKLPSDLTSEEKQQLAKDQLLVKDRRSDDQVTKLIPNSVPRATTNPSQTGIYDVLTGPDKYTKCFVAKSLVAPGGSVSYSLVMPLEGDSTGITADNSKVWVGSESLLSDYLPWFGQLEEVSPKPGPDLYVVVAPDGSCSVPFRIRYSTDGFGTEKTFAVDARSYPTVTADRNCTSRRYEEPYVSYDSQRVVLTGKKGSRLRSDGKGNVYVPDGCKFVLFEKASPEAWESWNKYDRYENERRSEFALASPTDMMTSFTNKQATVRVQKDHAGFFIAPLQASYSTKAAAMVAMIEQLGFRQSDAEHVLSEAEAGRQETFAVKYADELPPYLNQPGIVSPVMTPQDFGSIDSRTSSFPLEMQDQQFMPYENTGADTGSDGIWRQSPRDEMPDQLSRQIADAAASGQKEVFDTSILTTMLRANRDDLVIDRWIPDLVKAMDRLGRILFNFYWKQSVFADRYGQGKLPEIEDSLRNMFEGMGDMILQLKQQGIDPFQDEGVSVDLDALSQAS